MADGDARMGQGQMTAQRGERPGFTGDLWRAIEPIYAEIVRLPFLRGLIDGSLPMEAFRFYIIQDALYLRDYAHCLSLASARAPRSDVSAMFASHVLGIMAAEGSLHDTFFADFGITRAEVEQTPMAPTNLAYTSYLLRQAYGGDYAELLGAVLPCYWIYREVGQVLLAEGSPDPLFGRWIATYGGDEYGETVERVLEEMDRVGADLGPEQRAAVVQAFVTTSRYEWMFWDMGSRLEEWPV